MITVELRSAPMPSGRVLSPSAVAAAAELNPSWAYRAQEAQILGDPCYPADVIVLKVYRVILPLVWPDRVGLPRNEKKVLDFWQTAALEAARNAVTDDETTRETTMYVLQGATYIAHTRAARAALESASPDGDEPSPLDGQAVFRLPIGEWIDDLDSRLARLPRRAPRRGVAAKAVKAKQSPTTTRSTD
ncbi:hypothetical protein [Streptomyces sp. MZ04]|uniref:hypothetical protein n=1 Tax=Streptomyces sp. MZ04 TaxID=2559236 RepID=UPI00107EAA36|nr:hypothetical protein [Streptomyces sp. MZ04]TGA99688.1 hypothetical protein E2651_29405 [Streptomyces sp. MZ04]